MRCQAREWSKLRQGQLKTGLAEPVSNFASATTGSEYRQIGSIKFSALTSPRNRTVLAVWDYPWSSNSSVPLGARYLSRARFEWEPGLLFDYRGPQLSWSTIRHDEPVNGPSFRRPGFLTFLTDFSCPIRLRTFRSIIGHEPIRGHRRSIVLYLGFFAYVTDDRQTQSAARHWRS
jgi:hypothetical protein